MIVVGIDPSSHKMAAVITRQDNLLGFESVRLPEDKGLACKRAYEWVGFLIEEYAGVDPIHVYMEAPIMGVGGPGSTIPQAQVGGAVMAAWNMQDISVSLINNQSWKRQICGKGNIRKDQVAGAMMTVWPELVHSVGGDQDLIDAGAINMYGRRAVRLRAKVARHRAKGMQS